MKKILFLLLLGICVWCCAGCAGKPEETSDSETETAETTVTTTATTEAETTTVTTTTTVDYRVDTEMKLEVKTDTVRPSKCTAELTGGETQRSYTMNYRLYEVKDDSEKLCREQSDYEAPEQWDTQWIGPGETKELRFDWSKRFGDLQDGTYILELLLENTPADPEDPDSPQLRLVARAEFQMDSAEFVPQLIIEPDDIHPDGVVLTVKNSPDVGRSYSMVYHLYDESREPRVELLREIDQTARLYNNYHMDPGGELVLVYDWSRSYGPLLEGTYVIEIDLLADNESEGKVYRAEFEIK